MLGVPRLDALLEAVRHPIEATPQRPAWQSTGPTSPAVENDASGDDIQYPTDFSPGRPIPRPKALKAKPTTIELTSTKSATGKTTLLSYIAAISVLPKLYGGKDSTVIYIDTDGRFFAPRTNQIMHHHMDQQSTPPSALSDTDTVIHEALNHIHIFRPQSSTQLLSILTALPTYLFDPIRHTSTHRPLSAIVIDSATAFYWQDRFDRTMARLETPQGGRLEGPSPTQQIITRLKSLQEQFECVVLFSTTSASPTTTSNTTPLMNKEGGPTTPAPRQFERNISPWTAYATLTLSLSRIPVSKFAPQMTLEECIRDREKRFEVVKKGRVGVSVVGKGGEKGKGVGAFGFRIGDEGVEFE